MIRNIAVEKILTLLPIECGTCLTKKPINEILTHETKECAEQTATCLYKILGCEFTGKRGTLMNHMQTTCLYHNRPAKLLQTEIKRYVTEKIEDYRDNEKTLKLFSKKLAFVDFQLNSQRTDEYVSRLYSAFKIRKYLKKLFLKKNEREKTHKIFNNKKVKSSQAGDKTF